MAVVLIPLAGLFQVFDGIQVVSAGLMRGMADTRVPTLIHVLGFWGVGLPLGCGAGLRGPTWARPGSGGGWRARSWRWPWRSSRGCAWLLRRGVERLVIDAAETDSIQPPLGRGTRPLSRFSPLESSCPRMPTSET